MIQQRDQRRRGILILVLLFIAIEIPFLVEEACHRSDCRELERLVVAYGKGHGMHPDERHGNAAGPAFVCKGAHASYRLARDRSSYYAVLEPPSESPFRPLLLFQ